MRISWINLIKFCAGICIIFLQSSFSFHVPRKCSKFSNSSDGISAPSCMFSTVGADPELGVSCPSQGIIRIVGDYNGKVTSFIPYIVQRVSNFYSDQRCSTLFWKNLVLHINCTASYPIDFNFDGILVCFCTSKCKTTDFK